MDSTFPDLHPDAAKHISAFICAFVEPRKRDRWRSVLAMKPEKWLSVSAYDCRVEPAADPNTPPGDTLAKHGLMGRLDASAWVFPIGSGADDGAYIGTLRSALLSDETWELECVVSLLPGKLAVCGHSGEIRICKR